MSTVQEPMSDNPLLASQAPQSAGDYVRVYLRRVRQGDLGSLPIIVGLIVIAIIFQTTNQNFLTPRNFVSLILQMAGIATIAFGVVYVLLLGEIDLSVSYVSAVVGVGVTLMLRPPAQWPEWVPDFPWFLAIPFGLLLALGIGWLHGTIITFFQLPSFV
ncbi:MAG: hypothetical protein K8I30_23615, partial [Anaerolineae bacterium]|nr:hypothetical protein [Anaerolineae bacterium]